MRLFWKSKATSTQVPQSSIVGIIRDETPIKVTWKDLSFLPSDEALAVLYSSWSWLLPQTIEPIMASTLGDLFFQMGSEAVFWLNTGTAEVTQIAISRAHFMSLLRTDKAHDWFLPDLIRQLKEAGQTFKPRY